MQLNCSPFSMTDGRRAPLPMIGGRVSGGAFHARAGMAMGRRGGVILVLLALAAVGRASLEDEDWEFDDDDDDDADHAQGGEEAKPELQPNDKLMAGASGDDITLVKEALAAGANPNLVMPEDTGSWSVLMLSLVRTHYHNLISRAVSSSSDGRCQRRLYR